MIKHCTLWCRQVSLPLKPCVNDFNPWFSNQLTTSSVFHSKSERNNNLIKLSVKCIKKLSLTMFQVESRLLEHRFSRQRCHVFTRSIGLRLFEKLTLKGRMLLKQITRSYLRNFFGTSAIGTFR